MDISDFDRKLEEADKKIRGDSLMDVQRWLQSRAGINLLEIIQRRKDIYGKLWQHPTPPETPLAALIHAKTVLYAWYKQNLSYTERLDLDQCFEDLNYLIRDTRLIQKDVREMKKQDVKSK